MHYSQLCSLNNNLSVCTFYKAVKFSTAIAFICIIAMVTVVTTITIVTSRSTFPTVTMATHLGNYVSVTPTSQCQNASSGSPVEICGHFDKQTRSSLYAFFPCALCMEGLVNKGNAVDIIMPK
jgi:hypothetical protein